MDDYKTEESVGIEHLDRLSELPQSLILHILSFLPMRDVVSTTLLSKRWENMWTTLPCLNFSHIIGVDDEPDSHRVRNFVNRALIFWKGTKLLKFIMDIEHHFDKYSLADDMNSWVLFAVKNKVEELNISLEWDEAIMSSSKKDVYRPPQCLYLCSSIRKLSLVGCNLRAHRSPLWNQLKSLKIDGFRFSERVINRILLGTPKLEVFELRVIESNKNLNIRSTSLKKLKINKYLYFDGEQPSLGTMLRICCPNLETLELSGVFYSKCLFTNVSSLTDATLVFNSSGCYDARWIELLGEAMKHVFSTFQHVERVTLSSCSIKSILLSYQVLRASLKKNLFSPLPNVVFLKLEAYPIELVEMVHLLEIFPNLKMLVVGDGTFLHSPDMNADNYSEIETNLSKSFLLQLKIIEITSDFYDSSMFRCIEFLLKNCSMLERLVIRGKWIMLCSKARLLEVAVTLLSMPRSSPTAKLIFNNK